MLTAFRTHCQSHFPELFSARLVLALSGGIDSMVLADLAGELNWDCVWAHVNFQLRGDESENETRWLTQQAEEHQIALHKVYFDTHAYAQHHGLSTQLAARELRYRYFEEVAQKVKADFVLTAHHADDNTETFFINLTRASGIDGLVGIPSKNGRIRRPLLPFTREQIREYALARNIEWKEDSSNAKTVYLRNSIRHIILPELYKLHPQFSQQLHQTQQHLGSTQRMAQDAAVIVFQNVVKVEEEQWHIQLPALLQLPNYTDYLYYWLRAYGFQDWRAVYELVNAQTGKHVYSATHALLKNRDELILVPLAQNPQSEYTLASVDDFAQLPIALEAKLVNQLPSDLAQNTIFVDNDLATFPWKLRKAQTGDRFYPVGLNGNSKKVSKYFKDEKYAQIDKAKQWLLTDSNDQIIWIIGKRADARFTAKTNSTNILQLTVL